MLKGIRDVLFVLSFRQNVPAPWQPEEAAVQLDGNCLPYSRAIEFTRANVKVFLRPARPPRSDPQVAWSCLNGRVDKSRVINRAQPPPTFVWQLEHDAQDLQDRDEKKGSQQESHRTAGIQ